MKKLYCVAILSLFCHIAIAQKQLKLAPLSVDVMGTSVRMDYRIHAKKNVWYAGVGYLTNPPYNAKNPWDLFTNKAYATNFGQHFILNAGYERSFHIKDGKVRLYPFCEFALAQTGLKSEFYSPGSPGQTTSGYTYNFVYKTARALWVVNHIGIGAEIPLSKSFGLAQQIGFSPSLVKVKESSEMPNGEKYNRTQTYSSYGITQASYSFALTYKL